MGLNTEKYSQLLTDLLPQGHAWSRPLSPVIQSLLDGLAAEGARVECRGVDLLRESDPGQAVELLPDWERVLGLPDSCDPFPDGKTVEERQAALLLKLRLEYGQTIEFFIGLAIFASHVEATITELRPIRTGTAECTTNGTLRHWHAMFVWRVNSPAIEATPLRCGTGTCGQEIWTFEYFYHLAPLADYDPAAGDEGLRSGTARCGDRVEYFIPEPPPGIEFARCGSSCGTRLRWWGDALLECLMKRYKPAQTHVLFAYTEVQP